MRKFIFSVLALFLIALPHVLQAQEATKKYVQDKCDCDTALVRRWNEKYIWDFKIERECVDDDCSHPVELDQCPTEAYAQKLFDQGKAQVLDYFKKEGSTFDTVEVYNAIKEKTNHIIKIMQREVILASTLWDLEHLRFDSTEGIPPNFYEIARDNLPKTMYRAEQDQLNGMCSGDTIAYVEPEIGTEPNLCTLCDEFYSTKTCPLIRTMTLVHEARHRRKDAPGHVQCRAEKYKSDDSLNLGCDDKLEDNPEKGGGYNANVYFMWWVMNKLKTNDPKIRLNFRKELARVYQKDFVHNRFYKEPTAEQYKKYNVDNPNDPDQFYFPTGEAALKIAKSIEMVSVQGGSFEMGATDEMPAHNETVKSFNIGKFEITILQWKAVMGRNPSFYLNSDNYPAEDIRDDIELFIKKLDSMTRKNYRLPTEAEWEYAAKGGNQSRGYTFSGSNNIDEVASYHQGPYPVGQKKPNELGIYDMSGNVPEWCINRFAKVKHSNVKGKEQEEQEEPTPVDSYVVRGGGDDSSASDCAIGHRNLNYKGWSIGLRIACSE